MIEQCIKQLITEGKIPVSGFFDITEGILIAYIEAYSKLKGSSHVLKKSNYTYSRKLAGLNLTKLLIQRGYRDKIKSGFVYVISNPSFPDHFKIGMTVDIETRLAQYQTYDPYRQYQIEVYDFTLNRRLSERKLLNHWNVNVFNGEWIIKTDAVKIIQIIRDRGVTA